MRVIAGSARGRTLKGPPRRGGADAVRPSSDLMKGAIFSALEALGVDNSRVLDLYAGTGALGIEALSRDAGWCDFVEKERPLVKLIKENLAATGTADRGAVHAFPTGSVAGRLQKQYSLVLADPPYTDESAWRVLAEIAASGIVASGGTIVVEHASRLEPPAALGEFQLLRILRHGDSAAAIYSAAAGEAGE
jgi:16S rRNA (guanine(966)-N(2))-methyltransferase RsmD